MNLLKTICSACLLLLLWSGGLYAQRDETLADKLDLALSGAWGASNLGLGFAENESVIVAGGYGGLEFGKDFFIGWGSWSATEDVTYNPFADRTYRFEYSGMLIGYGPSAWKMIHPQFFLLFGRGSLRVPGGRDRVLVLQPSGGVEVNVFRWFRLGLQAGYRLLSDNDFEALHAVQVSHPFVEMSFRFGWSWGQL